MHIKGSKTTYNVDKIKANGRLKQSETCLHCYVDSESLQLIAPCREHAVKFAPLRNYHKNRDDKRKQIEMNLEVK